MKRGPEVPLAAETAAPEPSPESPRACQGNHPKLICGNLLAWRLLERAGNPPGVAPAVLLPGTVRSRGMDCRREGITS